MWNDYDEKVPFILLFKNKEDGRVEGQRMKLKRIWTISHILEFIELLLEPIYLSFLHAFESDWLNDVLSSYFQALRGARRAYRLIWEIQRTENKGTASNIWRVGRTCKQSHGNARRRYSKSRWTRRLFSIPSRCRRHSHTYSRVLIWTFLGKWMIISDDFIGCYGSHTPHSKRCFKAEQKFRICDVIK